MNSKRLRDYTTLFLDRNLGTRIVPEILCAQGIPYEIHDEHLAQNAPDEDWVGLCSNKRWIAITPDSNLERNSPVQSAARKSKIAIFVIPMAGSTGEEKGKFIALHYDNIMKFSRRTRRPFLAKITKDGHIRLSKRFPLR